MMESARNKTTAVDSQAWRKRSRKFASKSRLGCKTCKIRRVKCDLSQPACRKCHSTGRTCDGYAEPPPTKNIEILPCITHFANPPLSQCHSSISQPLGSLMILEVSDPTEAEAMCFFQRVSIIHLNEYRPCESWRKALLFFSQTIPPVRHAAIALAMIQRHFVDQDSKRGNAMLCVQGRCTDQTPLLHYNRAIRLLLHPDIGKGSHGIAVTLLVCYLFVCFDQLMGNNVQALKHLNGGLELSRNINNTTFGESAAQNARSSEADAIICHVEKQIRRFDLQAGMVLVDWVPTNMHQPYMPEPGLFDATCWSLNHAADHLQNILAQLMMLRNTGRRGSQARGILPAHLLLKNTKDSVVDQLEKWSILFDDFLQRAAIPNPSIETDLVVPLLRLQQIVAWILVQSDGVNAEMKYDEFLPQFRQSITQARQVAMAHRRYAGTLRSTFTPEIGFVPILYIIGAKCRHPALRREASSILRQQLVRESVWDSIATARILDRVIEIEEATIRQDQKAQFMGIIPIWQRIDELSFTHIPVEHSSTGVRITYTFCFRTEIHVESLGSS